MRSSCQALLMGILAIAAACPAWADDGPARWYRGNTHTHTLWSDGDTFPEMAVDWYKSHGYEFLVLTDHDVLQQGEKWRDITKEQEQFKVIENARKKFGEDAVTTRPAEGGKIEAKLMSLDALRGQFERTGEFILITGEEITGNDAHVNGVNITRQIPRSSAPTTPQRVEEEVAAVAAQNDGDHVTAAIVNHPNFCFALKTQDLIETKAKVFEICNPDPTCFDAGDRNHPGTMRMWDVSSVVRISRKVDPLFGVGADDTHYYHGAITQAAPGKAWIMVRSPQLTSNGITKAMLDGDFYASTGVLLRDVNFDKQAGKLTVEVQPQQGVEYTIEFIGTMAGVFDASAPVEELLKSDEIGTVLLTVNGEKASYELTGKELYVRAVVTCSKKLPYPTFAGKDSHPQAWTQPVGWKK